MRNCSMYRLIGLAMFLALASVASATGPLRAPVATGEFYSQNPDFVLVLDLMAQEYTVFAVKNRNAPLWSFPHPPAWGTFRVSDDGQCVADLTMPTSRPWNGETVCLRFWNAAGNFKT